MMSGWLLPAKTIAHQLEDATLSNLRLEQFLAIRLQALEDFRLNLLHETAVADHVGGEHGSETALQAGSLQPKTTDWHATPLWRSAGLRD